MTYVYIIVYYFYKNYIQYNMLLMTCNTALNSTKLYFLFLLQITMYEQFQYRTYLDFN